MQISSITLCKESLANQISLNESEAKLFKSALKEGDKKKWARSIKYIDKINNPDIKKIIEWRWLISNDGIASIKKLKEFYAINKNWPRIKNIKKKIEAKVNINDYEREMCTLWPW